MKKKNKEIKIKKNSKSINYILAFFIPFMLIILVFILQKITPFGNFDLLISDAGWQYIDYLGYLKTILVGENNLLYTFSKNLGGNMIDLSAYYLLSPINLLIFLFEDIDNAFTFIVATKLSLCSLTFYYYAIKSNYSKFSSLFFSISYAFIGYNLAYYWDIMWIDGVILLPIVTLGINKIINKEKPHIYIISLFLSILTNYYIGYMICIYSIIYFIYKIALKTDKLEEIKEKLLLTKTYIISSFVAGLLSFFYLIPILFSLQGGKANFQLSILEFRPNFLLDEIVTKLFSNNLNFDQLVSGLPNIFIGITCLFLVIIFFINKKISLKQKYLTAILLAIFIISFHINTFNLIWHGFNTPAWFPYRYSFLFCFILIDIAIFSFNNLNKENKIKDFQKAYLIVIALMIFVLSNIYQNITEKGIYFDFIILTIFTILLYLYTEKKIIKKKLIPILLILLQISYLSLNYYLTLNHLKKQVDLPIYIEENKQVIDEIKENDRSFYRLEKNYQRSNNDPMMFSYNGLSHFSSSEKEFVYAFMEDLGFRSNKNWAYYNNGSTISIESLLGIKYLISEEEINRAYEYYDEVNGKLIYKNQYHFPLGFVAESTILNTYDKTNNTFQIQNEIWTMIHPNINDNIFTEEKNVKRNLINLEEKETGIYTKINSKDTAYINYEIEITSNDNLYTYLTSETTMTIQNANLIIEGKDLGKYFDTFRWDVVDLGNYEIGDKITLTVEVKQDQIIINDAYFYYESIDVLEKYYNEIVKENSVKINQISSSKFEINTTVEEEKYLVTTIPYENDWKITINDKIIQPEKAIGNLLSFKLQTGENNIKISYIPSGLIIGIIISIGTLICYVIYIIKTKKLN